MSGFQPLAWLRGLVASPPRPATRLSSNEALANARAAAERAEVSDELEVMDVRIIKDRLCWILGTTTKDAGWSVIVDDATGATSEPQAWNGWSPKA